MGYVSRYGNWGTEDVLIFDDGELTDKQWELLDILPDSDKIKYVQALLDGEDVSEWEGEDA